jgi:hypothetical protein
LLDGDVAGRLVRDNEGKKPPSLELFLEYLGMTEDEFNRIVAKTVVSPWSPNFKEIKWAPKTHDFDQWYRDPSGILRKAK